MNIRTASIVLPMVLFAVGVAGCDRRDVEPIEPSDTTDTVVDETPATPAPDTPAPTTPAPEATPPAASETCAGLTGEAEADCLMRNNDGLPPTPPPVNPEEETGDDAPPTP